MLTSLAKLYEEGRVMKARNTELEEQLRVMTETQSSASTSSQDARALLGKYLRADSFR